MEFYWGSAEIPALRSHLVEEGLTNWSLSWPRVAQSFEDTVPESTSLVLVPVWQTFDSAEALRDEVDSYYDFAEKHEDRFDLIIEYPLLNVAPEDVDRWRDQMLTKFSNFVPIWSPVHGLEKLGELAVAPYQRVAVSLSQRENLSDEMKETMATAGSWHAFNFFRPSVYLDFPWDSANSNAWTIPARQGDTMVWTGPRQRLRGWRWHSAKYIHQRRRYRASIRALGCDPDAVVNSDPAEVSRLAIRSMKAVLDYVEGTRETVKLARQADRLTEQQPDRRVEVTRGEIVHTAETLSGLLDGVARERPLTTHPDQLPILLNWTEFTPHGQVKRYGASTETVRVCDSCFLANKCPRFSPGASCSYKIPVEITTDDDLVSLSNAMIEIQAQRVIFARFAEEVDGGAPDPATSQEMDRLSRLVRQRRDLTKQSASLMIKAEASGGGILSRLFGPPPETPALPPG